MVFGTIVRRSASRFVPMAIRAIRTQRQPGVLFSVVSHRGDVSGNLFWNPLPPVLNYSTNLPKSDESLIRVIETEIKCAEESEDHNEVEDIPEGFPFKIQDNPGEQTISLTREYQGETVDVEVHMPDLGTAEEDDENDNDDTEKENQSSFPLVVRVTKKCGSILEFGCTAYHDEIAIDGLSLKDPNAGDQIPYEGPDFSDLDESLQKAFHKYLEIRGIKSSMTIFLNDYMTTKDSREYLMWLKNLKEFVEA